MPYTYLYNTETKNYWKLLKDVRSEVKLQLITLLSQSVIKDVDKTTGQSTENNVTRTFLAKYNGIWSDNDSADDIIARINDGHSCKDPISFD